MKIRFCLCPAGLLLAAAVAAAPLQETTAIHNQPDVKAPVVGFLKAGTEPKAAADATAPTGWMAVSLPGPHQVYVHNDDLSKDLHVHPGADLLLRPEDKAPVLAKMKEGDEAEITGLRPGWTQIKLSDAVVGYIQVGTAASAAPGTSAPAAAATPASAATGTPPAGLSNAPAGALPSTFNGRLVEAKRFLLVGRRPPYPYQLEDTDGSRVAYLDLTSVLPTISIDRCLDQSVTVSGVLKQAPDGKNLVIVVDSLHLK